MKLDDIIISQIDHNESIKYFGMILDKKLKNIFKQNVHN